MISRLMDFIERAQKAQSDVDKHVALANKKLDMEIALEKTRIEKEILLAKAAQAQNMSSNLYYPSQQGIQSNYGSVVNAPPYTSTTTANAMWVSYPVAGAAPGNGYGAAIPAGTAYPVATGTSAPMILVDADGFEHTITLDVGFVSLINQINNAHRSFTSSRPKALPDPEFDLDEMEKASEILEGLDGSRP